MVEFADDQIGILGRFHGEIGKIRRQIAREEQFPPLEFHQERIGGQKLAFPGHVAVRDRRDFQKAVVGLDSSEAAVIMCSALGQQAMVIEAIQSGAKDFIVKPFQADRVIEAVKKVVG